MGNDLDLAALAVQIPCSSGAEDCRCEGCIASAAVGLADDHLGRGELLDASVKLGHAAHFFPWRPVVEAHQQVEALLLAPAEVAS